MIRCHIFVIGSVQGVLFRRFVYRKANHLDLKGWVRNKDHNQVEIVVEGEEEKVNKLISLCREGPPNAEVKDIKIEKEIYRGDLNGFGIAYS